MFKAFSPAAVMFLLRTTAASPPVFSIVTALVPLSITISAEAVFNPIAAAEAVRVLAPDASMLIALTPSISRTPEEAVRF